MVAGAKRLVVTACRCLQRLVGGRACFDFGVAPSEVDVDLDQADLRTEAPLLELFVAAGLGGTDGKETEARSDGDGGVDGALNRTPLV